MTPAPILAAISGVPSFELLSTTMTSVARSEGRSAKTRSIACASLWVGMMTDTRTYLIRSPPRRRWPPLRQQTINAPSPAGASDGEAERCEHRNQQFPDPRGAKLRNPKAAEKQKSYKCGRPGKQTDDEQDTERDLGQPLQGSSYRGMVCRQAHHRLPCSRAVARVDVVIDEARVTCRFVEALPQILKKDPQEHRADRHSHDCQTIRCLRLVGHCGYVTS